MAKSKTQQVKGLQFQQDVFDFFEELKRTEKVFVDKLYDTSTLRGAGSKSKATIPDRAGDMQLVYHGIPIMVECKTSAKHSSLITKAAVRELVRAGQSAEMELFCRAGGLGFYVFRDDTDERHPFRYHLALAKEVRALFITEERGARLSYYREASNLSAICTELLVVAFRSKQHSPPLWAQR